MAYNICADGPRGRIESRVFLAVWRMGHAVVSHLGTAVVSDVSSANAHCRRDARSRNAHGHTSTRLPSRSPERVHDHRAHRSAVGLSDRLHLGNSARPNPPGARRLGNLEWLGRVGGAGLGSVGGEFVVRAEVVGEFC